MPLSPTANMGLVKPEVGPGGTAGPGWATLLNTIVDVLDAHDHSSGKGKAISTSGIAIDDDLELNSHDLTEVGAVQIEDQVSNRVGAGLLYRVGENLVYNNGSGAVIQVTNGTAVNNSVSGAFSALTPGTYPYTVSASDAQKVLRVNTSAARTINLPAATTAVLFIVKDVTGSAQTNAISIVPNGSNTIDGSTGTRQLVKNFGMWIFVSDGVSDWSIGEMTPDVTPIGSIQMFGGASAPGGWLVCDGSAVSRSTYANLFGIIGVAYGAGDGTTTFNLPDLRQRFPLGKAASGTGAVLGSTGGSIDHTHSIPAHYHGMGTGANLAISSSGSHTHTIDHDHGSFTSGAESGHTHAIDHDHGSFNSSDGNSLNYDLVDGSNANDGGGTSSLGNTFLGYRSSAAFSNYTSQNYPGQDHVHTIDVPAFTGTSGASSGHTHTIDPPSFSGSSGSAAHTHASGDITGVIGLLTGGVNGNTVMTSGANNPPFLSLNFIIKF